MSFHRSPLRRLSRVLLVSVILAAALLVAPPGDSNAWVGMLQAPIRSVTGAHMGTATFTAEPSGGVRIQITVSGYNPVGGDRRLSLRTAYGTELYVFPNIQFYPNGSANYETVVSGISMDWLAAYPGATLIIQADTWATSAIIGWGPLSGISGPAWPWPQPPTPPAPPPPPPPPPPWYPPTPPTPPAPPPPAIVGCVRVTAGLGLNLRSGPGTGYAIRRIVGVGTSLDSTGIYQWANGYKWLKVRYGGTYYWAASAWLQAY